MKKIQDAIIYQNTQTYAAFPCLEKCQNGDLLAAFRAAPREPSIYHFHSQSQAMLARSTDGGVSWSEPAAILPDLDLAQQDPHITMLPGGELLMTAFLWQFHAACERDSLRDVYMEIQEVKGGIMRCAGIITALSLDNGHTWQDQGKIRIADAPRSLWACSAMHSKVVALPDGGILLPCRVESRAGYLEYLIRSDDQGKSWCFVSEIVSDQSTEHYNYYDECFLYRTAGGRLVCFLRCYQEGGLMEICFSDDDGLHWSKPAVTTVWGYPQSICRLTGGKALLTYGYRRPPYGVRARIVDDDCQGIDSAEEFSVYSVNEAQARAVGNPTDLGYPSGVELTDGRAIIAYYCYDLNNFTSCIRATTISTA